MDNKLDINVTEKKVSDENLLKTVEEALMQNELCLFMGETNTFMTTRKTDDAERNKKRAFRSYPERKYTA